MKAEAKIPKGWRQVKRGKSRDGDRFLCMAFMAGNISWQPSDVNNDINPLDVYIRRKVKMLKKVKK